MSTSITMLNDITKLSVGAVPIARGLTAAFPVKTGEVKSASNGRAVRRDPTYHAITASMSAEDPLSVPLVLALSGSQTLIAGGRSMATGAYQDQTLLHALLTGFSMDIVHQAAGKCSYDFANKAAAGATLAAELSEAVGSRQGQVLREGTIEIVSAVFTDDASSELTITGAKGLSLRGKCSDVQTACTPGFTVADLVDLSESWDVDGSLDIDDHVLTSTQALASQLVALRRGALVLTCEVSGYSAGAAAPANKVVTIDRLKFVSPSYTFGKKPKASSVAFDLELIDDAGAETTLADLITIADET